jgi:hypothetical protein
MDTVGSSGEGNVRTGVDQESGSQSPVLSSQFLDRGCGLPGKPFQLARRQIFFAELDVVDSRAGGFRDFLKKVSTSGRLVSGKRGAVGDVVEKAALRHQLSIKKTIDQNAAYC